jgi:hypothetical protein
MLDLILYRLLRIIFCIFIYILFIVFFLYSGKLSSNSYFVDTVKRINRSSFGYVHYASKLERNFLVQLEYISNKHGFDPNELLALIHQESLYNPGSFNVNPYVMRFGRYYASGSGNVGILQFSHYWISPLHPYKFSLLSRMQQLNYFDRRLEEFKSKEPIYKDYVSVPGGLACIIWGPYNSIPSVAYQVLRNPYNGCAYSMYFSGSNNFWNGGKIAVYNKSKKNFESHLEEYIQIEQNYYKKKYLMSKSLSR